MEQYIEVVKYLRSRNLFTEVPGALEFLINDNYKSIVFINISMAGISAGSFFDNLKPFQLGILTSENKKDNIIASEKGASGFLTEPVVFSRFLETVTEAREKLSFIEGSYQIGVSKPEDAYGKADKKKYSGSPLTDEQKEILFSKVMQFIDRENYYINTHVTLTDLAERLNSNRSYLSQVINEKKSMGFSALINEYRVKEAIRLLLDPVYDGLSIEGISRSVGFNSKSAFYSAFQKITGLTPHEYKKLKRL